MPHLRGLYCVKLLFFLDSLTFINFQLDNAQVIVIIVNIYLHNNNTQHNCGFCGIVVTNKCLLACAATQNYYFFFFPC